MTLFSTVQQDTDPEETREWVESLGAVTGDRGPNRSRYLLAMLLDEARRGGFVPDQLLATDYVNTIALEHEPTYPGDEALEERIDSIIRWNAALMVVRANSRSHGLGGHLATFASSAELYDVAFNHFLRGKDDGGSGDQVFYQGHASPGIYARSFLEGRFDEAMLENFRRESDRGKGLSSYPHPRLMPEYWEFPTVSMGLGPIASIYQARYNRYLHARGIKDTSESRVWAFVGDGETDEPESLGALSVAAREGLDNLVWVVNCNLQRLDGPVRGNGKILQELETVFRGAGWNVIKVVWGREWDPLLAADTEGLLRRRLNELLDGHFQKMRAEGGAAIRTQLFGADPRLLELVAHLDDAQMGMLRRGGHDRTKVHAAYRAAVEHRGRPTVVLAHTVKGWDLGKLQSSNRAHQIKELDAPELKALRDRLELPIADAALETMPYYHPGPDSPEVRYLAERRAALGGPIPKRRSGARRALAIPPATLYEEFAKGTAKPVSTTMAFVSLLTKLLKDPAIGARIVPIIPDEARTFGMDPLFSSVGIYDPQGQRFESTDAGMLLRLRMSEKGQVLEEGITEAGSMASFLAAGTSYATHGEPTIPFYVFYSMFGMQRVGDQIWQFGDARGRGFLMGGTAGRTTLNGEGLQHEDGHSHLLATAVPNLIAYDPAFAYDIAVIVEEGLRRMIREEQDVFYYITLQNENYVQQPMPGDVKEGILRGIYKFRDAPKRLSRHVQLFGSGCAMNFALEAQELLAKQHGVSADVWNVTSYQQLRRDALDVERHNRLHPDAATPRRPYLETALEGVKGPFIAVSDYVKLMPDMVARWIPGRLTPLGTDGFGMSDTREALRRHFEIDAPSIVIATLEALASEGQGKKGEISAAFRTYAYDPEKLRPSSL